MRIKNKLVFKKKGEGGQVGKRKYLWGNSGSEKTDKAGKMLARKMLPISITSFEVFPYDFIKIIASNKS